MLGLSFFAFAGLSLSDAYTSKGLSKSSSCVRKMGFEDCFTKLFP